MMDTNKILANQGDIPRKFILFRLLYTLFFFIVFEILKTVIQVTAVFQYVYLLITRSYSNPLRRFSNKVSAYAYKVMRYITLNDNIRPFPFSDFPNEIDEPADKVDFN